MEIIFKCIDSKDVKISNVKEITDIVKLVNLNESLMLNDPDYDRSFFVELLNKVLLNNELQIIESLVAETEDLEKFATAFIDEIEEQIFLYFNSTNIKIFFDSSFFEHISFKAKGFVKAISNGCGSQEVDVPDLIFTQSCDVHDAMYQVTETELEKSLADDFFLDNMLHQSKEHYKLLYPLFKMAAVIYYKGVDWFGKSSTNIKDK